MYTGHLYMSTETLQSEKSQKMPSDSISEDVIIYFSRGHATDPLVLACLMLHMCACFTHCESSYPNYIASTLTVITNLVVPSLFKSL